ncbi:hypothetical protein DSLPV1_037 [Dishui lake phycodnavirus 1]|uniref:hypothetical protein n=1 Tax=Dishui lake phycodnavirus 1 TaxID=2079134 RepID=UPI000CD6A06D|nr:hypothetical protein C5Y57_gp037 [Dishui lake phycodnavirus 1]AUT19008.1 hypothetical protein DSLPV1_037 [Dishui lake phycodnavirus 1]
MTIAESTYVLCCLFAHALKRTGRMSFEEKIKLLQVICHLASNPHTGVVLDRDGTPRLSGIAEEGGLLQSISPTRSLLSAPGTPSK